jgi:hypothetical protein
MSIVDETTVLQAARMKQIDALRAEIDAGAPGTVSLARRSIKTEGERVIAVAVLQWMELETFGEVRTQAPSRHHA